MDTKSENMKLTKDDIKPVGRLWKDRELGGCEYVLPLSRLREVVCEFRKTRPFNLLFQEDIDDAFGEVLE